MNALSASCTSIEAQPGMKMMNPNDPYELVFLFKDGRYEIRNTTLESHHKDTIRFFSEHGDVLRSVLVPVMEQSEWFKANSALARLAQSLWPRSPGKISAP